MQYDDFTKQYDRLATMYGKNFNEERKKVFWEYFKHERSEIFLKAVDFVIGEKNSPPSASDLRAAIGPGEKNPFTRPKPDWDCSWCGQSGLVRAKDNNSRYTANFICPCEFGLKFQESEDLKMWSKRWESAYTLFIWAQGTPPNAEPNKIKHREIKDSRQNDEIALCAQIVTKPFSPATNGMPETTDLV